MAENTPRYPGIPVVIHGNGAVAHVMSNVCGGVIGYPITPSTEIAELYEAARAEGHVNVWGRKPFFFEPEGEHSAQSGALGAALTGGQFVSNASSSQGILYAMESHYVTVGKKIGGFVLQVAARVVSKHALNVMAGHDDIYALLPSGYTVLFGSNAQEAADLAAIAYRTSALSLIPVANAMDGFSTSHMLGEARLPEPELLREYLGDPSGRIPCPTVAQEVLFGAKGRVFQLGAFLDRRAADIAEADLAALRAHLAARADAVEADDAGDLLGETTPFLPADLHAVWRRAWLGAHAKGTRPTVPALVDVDNPGLTGPVQNQPDFQAGAVDHRTHFASAVPELVRQAMREYTGLTGRLYEPVRYDGPQDAEVVMVGLGSVIDDVRAVLPHLNAAGVRAAVVGVTLLQPFPEAELVEALAGRRAVLVLERSDQTALTALVTQALFKARENAACGAARHRGVPALEATPVVSTAIFGLGGHDLQPRHLIAAFEALDAGTVPPLIYLGSQFFDADPDPRVAQLQERMRQAYPETEAMALATRPNPQLLPEGSLRIRFHSVGGYGTIATGKLLTDVLAGVLGLHSKAAPKYGSEKSGAPTNYYITLSPEPILVTNAELEDVEVVVSPDHKAFVHTNPLKGIQEGGTLILQSSSTPEEVWRELPRGARRTIRAKRINLVVIDAFAVARRHAPTPDLETRMMGIAFIGAVAAHLDRITSGASALAVAERVEQQIATKFGRKGEAVVASNMAVIRDGMAATLTVDYDSPALREADEVPAALPLHTVAASAGMCASTAQARTSGLFDPAYYEDIAARPFREGTIGESPVMPGAGLFMPAGSAAAKDKGLFRRTVPDFDADTCTGCLDCTLVCPDAAIPGTVHEIHDLIATALDAADLTSTARDAARRHVHTLAARTRALLRAKDTRPFHELVAAAVAELPDEPSLRRTWGLTVQVLAAYPVARTRPFFDAAEQAEPGSGALFSAVVDPWKCTGCLECIDVCGPGALSPRDQDAATADTLQARFDFLSHTPATPSRFVDGAISPGGDIKRLMLDRSNFYATTGGHGGCRGCGEVTAIRLVMSTAHALGDRRRALHLAELTGLVDDLHAKLGQVDDPARRDRLTGALRRLERRLYHYEGGPTGNGPSPAVIANSTGCSSVYASTMPFNSYLDPWVNSLFQDAQPLAKGIFEGLAAHAAQDMRALRTARLELADAYDPAVHDDALEHLAWGDFTAEEMALLPTIMTVGGDGATYDIGFGALSRILASDTPLKVLVLNSGVYSNTGGQASTSSFTGQDSDLARFGAGNSGKHESRKELGLLASFHPHVFVCSTSTASQGHFLRNTLEVLGYAEGPAVLDVYTPCGSEHGIPEAASARRAALAVESRMNPLFVHDPRRGSTLHDWFSIEGNPAPDTTWTTTVVEYLDADGAVHLLETPLTPAEFALGEVRFKKQFRRLAPHEEASAVPIAEYVDLPPAQRAGHLPFTYATDDDRHLVKIAVSDTIVGLVEERRRNWQLLQYLSGQQADRLDALHASDLAELQARYDEAIAAREAGIDDIAQAMADLASASRAPVGGGFTAPPVGAASARAAAPAPAPAAAATAVSDVPVRLDPADQGLCTDCGTCHQELPQVFERARVVVDGEAKWIARMIPGAAEALTVTDELRARIARVVATCDAEIIR